MTHISKAFKDGVRGKYRRVDGGKVKFIRSHDGVVEKDATSTAGMQQDLGDEAGVHSTDPGTLCKCGQHLAKCACVHKNADCDCTHDGLCRDAADCDCDCDDRATCSHKGEKLQPPSIGLAERAAPLDLLIKVLEGRLR